MLRCCRETIASLATQHSCAIFLASATHSTQIEARLQSSSSNQVQCKHNGFKIQVESASCNAALAARLQIIER